MIPSCSMQKPLKSLQKTSWPTLLALLLTGFFLFPALSSASSLGSAGDFNVFVLDDLTLKGSDSWGSVAVGGKATLQNFGVASKLSGAGAQLVVGGDIIAADGSVGGGTGTINASGTPTLPASVTYGALLSDPGSVVDFSAAASFLQQSANAWGGLAANGTTILNYSTLTLTGTDPTLNIFAVSGADLSAAKSFVISAPAGSTVLANISGTGVSFANAGNTLVGVDQTHVLYNYYQAQNLTFNGVGIQGSVLAPYADIYFSSGNINGQMIASAIGPIGSGNTGEFHSFNFTGDLPPAVPIPGAAWLLGSGLIGLLGTRGVRRG